MAPVAADSQKNVWGKIAGIDSQIAGLEAKITKINREENGQWEKGDVNPEITLLKSQIYDLCKKRRELLSQQKK